MRRDMELIRKIMLAAEPGPSYATIDGYTDEEIRYHKKLAIEKGLLQGIYKDDSTQLSDIPRSVIVKGVTWEGHDFIQAIREDAKWEKVKKFLIEAGKDITIETVKEAVKVLFGFG